MGHANMNAIREVTAQATHLHTELTYGVYSGRQELEPGIRACRELRYGPDFSTEIYVICWTGVNTIREQYLKQVRNEAKLCTIISTLKKPYFGT